MNDEIVQEVGRIPRNRFADISVSVRKHTHRLYITLEEVPADCTDLSGLTQHRAMSLSPAVVRDLLPLMSEAQALAARFEGEEE